MFKTGVGMGVGDAAVAEQRGTALAPKYTMNKRNFSSVTFKKTH